MLLTSLSWLWNRQILNHQISDKAWLQRLRHFRLNLLHDQYKIGRYKKDCYSIEILQRHKIIFATLLYQLTNMHSSTCTILSLQINKFGNFGIKPQERPPCSSKIRWQDLPCRSRDWTEGVSKRDWVYKINLSKRVYKYSCLKQMGTMLS